MSYQISETPINGSFLRNSTNFLDEIFVNVILVYRESEPDHDTERDSQVKLPTFNPQIFSNDVEDESDEEDDEEDDDRDPDSEESFVRSRKFVFDRIVELFVVFTGFVL